MGDPDAELMLALGRGDGGAFDRLFGRWAPPLLRYLERMVGDSAVAEELVQESFLRLYRARERYEPKAKFSTWLYTIAANTARNELRRPFRRHLHEVAEEGSELTLPSRAEAVDVQAAQREEIHDVSDALVRLPERQREALLLVAEGLSYAEIAELQGTSVSATKALVHRSRGKLAQHLDELGGREG